MIDNQEQQPGAPTSSGAQPNTGTPADPPPSYTPPPPGPPPGHREEAAQGLDSILAIGPYSGDAVRLMAAIKEFAVKSCAVDEIFERIKSEVEGLEDVLMRDEVYHGIWENKEVLIVRVEQVKELQKV
jgi:hypothetical protein